MEDYDSIQKKLFYYIKIYKFKINFRSILTTAIAKATLRLETLINLTKFR